MKDINKDTQGKLNITHDDENESKTCFHPGNYTCLWGLTSKHVQSKHTGHISTRRNMNEPLGSQPDLFHVQYNVWLWKIADYDTWGYVVNVFYFCARNDCLSVVLKKINHTFMCLRLCAIVRNCSVDVDVLQVVNKRHKRAEALLLTISCLLTICLWPWTKMHNNWKRNKSSAFFSQISSLKPNLQLEVFFLIRTAEQSA